MLSFLGRESAFGDSHNSAFFVEDNRLVLIDCPATTFLKVKKWKLEQFDEVYILVTHTHGDHAGGVGMMLQYMFFAVGKKATIVAPSIEVRDDLIYMLNHIEGCEDSWYNIVVAEDVPHQWMVCSVKVPHSRTLEGRCFGYVLRLDNALTIYSGDTHSLEPFREYISEGAYLYSEIALHDSGVHLYYKDVMPVLLQYAEEGVHVYVMHLDDEKKMAEILMDTPINKAPLWQEDN